MSGRLAAGLAGDGGLVGEAEDVAGDGERDPGEAVLGERDLDGFGDRAEVHAGGFETGDRGHHEREGGGEGVDALAAVEELVREEQHDQDHAERVDEHQDRDRGDDDGLEAEHADQERDDREEQAVLLVRQAADDAHEVGGAAGDEADGRRQAGEQHDDREKDGAEVAEEDLGRTQRRSSR